MDVCLHVSLQVTNCSAGVDDIQAQSASLAAQASQTLVFTVLMNSAAAQVNNTCNVSMIDSTVSTPGPEIRIFLPGFQVEQTLASSRLHPARCLLPLPV